MSVTEKTKWSELVPGDMLMLWPDTFVFVLAIVPAGMQTTVYFTYTHALEINHYTVPVTTKFSPLTKVFTL